MPSQRRSSPPSTPGVRTVFFDAPSVDQLLAMLLTLSGEVWALRERLMALEAIASRQGVALPAEIEKYEFTEEEEARVAGFRREFLASLFGTLTTHPAKGDTAKKGSRSGKRSASRRSALRRK